ASAAGLASTAPAGYWYADTSSITAPLKSFGLHSEQANQKLLFILFDDTIPIDDLNAYVDEPPYTNLVKVKQLDEGDRQLGAVQMQWVSCEYKPGKSHKKFKGTDLLDDKDHRPEKEPVLVASFPAVEKGKSILIVGQSYAPDKVFEKDDALFILDSLVDKSKQPAGATSDADSSSTSEDKNATDGKTGEAAETSSQPDDKSTADKQAGDGANQGKDSH
ncbi:MAG: hypothetical protein K2Z81_17365, partial [Cyanobacteria bacterium]|nr:hypothetical protein [Cyanobacteriota bacterium]